jgi:pimeloyl-ACP methyl ester carboxylesterase
MPTVTLPGGATFWYRTTGQKTGTSAPLLHIHGSAFGHRNFEKLSPHMAQHFEVIDFDLPGYGESRGGQPLLTMADIAAQVHLLILALGHQKVHIHGTSFGAMIALTLAAAHPEVVDKLVLSCFLARYDNAARMMRGTWKRCAKDSGMQAVADLTSVAGFARGYYDRPEAQTQLAAMREAFSQTTPEAFIAGTETIERTDLSPLAPQVKTPTLLLAGAEDNMTPFKPADSGVGFSQIQKLMPDNRLVVLPECGHYLVIEQPELACAEIVKFIGMPV